MAESKNKSTKRLIPISIGVVAIGLLIFLRPKPSADTTAMKPGKTPPPLVSFFVARPSKMENIYFTSGTVLSNESVDLKSEVAGRVVQILFTEGTAVRKGQLLLKLNDDDLQAQLKKAQSVEITASSDEERAQKLLKISGISQQDYDAALNTLNSAKADIENLQAAIEKTEIHAPFDGSVGLRNISVGSFLPAGTYITTLQQTNPVKIDFTLPEKYASQITNNTSISFTVDGIRDTFAAKTYANGQVINANTGTLELRALCPNPTGKLLPGAFAHVIVNLKTVENAIMVPSQALVPKQNIESVYLVKKGVAVSQKVFIGLRTDSTVEITQGISSGDTVITSAMLAVKPGLPVRFNSNPGQR